MIEIRIAEKDTWLLMRPYEGESNDDFRARRDRAKGRNHFDAEVFAGCKTCMMTSRTYSGGDESDRASVYDGFLEFIRDQVHQFVASEDDDEYRDTDCMVVKKKSIRWISCWKNRYPTKRDAVTAMNLRMNGRKKNRRNRPEHLRVYRCQKCRGWHLTKLDKNI